VEDKRKQWLGLAALVVVCLGAGGLGSVFTRASIGTWYPTIEKPSWNPPGWVFGPVWTALYVMMAVAAWLVWRPKGVAGARVPLGLFAVQLALNAAWSPVFFGLRSPGAAFGVIVALWIAIVATVVSFLRANAAAGWLLVPYLGWVSFASVLNFTIWRLNA
jgi:tryptophan-rich sensory protein